MHRVITSIAALLLAACAQVTTTHPGIVGVDRPQNLSYPVQDYKQKIEEFVRRTSEDWRQRGLNDDEATVARLRAIAHRLIPHTGVFRSDAPGWNWEIDLLRSPELNALSLGEGKIVFYSGIIEYLKLTDDEIAAVMGHEIAHALREHGRERLSQRARSESVATVLGALFGGGRHDVLELSSQFYLIPNTREQETEADRIGIELAARAGYDPRGAVSLWQKFQRRTYSHGVGFLSTHPSHESRMQDLWKYIDKVSGVSAPR